MVLAWFLVVYLMYRRVRCIEPSGSEKVCVGQSCVYRQGRQRMWCVVSWLSSEVAVSFMLDEVGHLKSVKPPRCAFLSLLGEVTRACHLQAQRSHVRQCSQRKNEGSEVFEIS